MPDIPDELVQAFRDRRATFFLAAGCSIPSGIPSAREVAEQVALAEYVRAGSPGDFPQFKTGRFGSQDPDLDDVAEYYYARGGGDLADFVSLIRFDGWNVPSNQTHKGVVRLAREGFVNRVLTTNWDTLVEMASQEARCRMVSVRSFPELGQTGDVELRLLKIHGCRSDPSSIVAARSQIEGVDPKYLWARPQVLALFQDTSIVFTGYSGSIQKISATMSEVAKWSPDNIRHYGVDTLGWEAFSERAPDFVAAARLTDESFFDCGGEEFLVALVDRVLRAEVVQAIHQWGKSEMDNLLELGGSHPGPFEPSGAFIEGVASAEGLDSFLGATLRSINVYPPLRSNEHLIARMAAWFSILTSQGWTPLYGLPIFVKEGKRIYFAAPTNGASAKIVARHVLATLENRRTSDVILGQVEDAKVICVLLCVQGTATGVLPQDLLTGDGAANLAHGRFANLQFRTEHEFLAEVA